jgi:hypothetical protein
MHVGDFDTCADEATKPPERTAVCSLLFTQ